MIKVNRFDRYDGEILYTYSEIDIQISNDDGEIHVHADDGTDITGAYSDEALESFGIEHAEAAGMLYQLNKEAKEAHIEDHAKDKRAEDSDYYTSWKTSWEKKDND